MRSAEFGTTVSRMTLYPRRIGPLRPYIFGNQPKVHASDPVNGVFWNTNNNWYDTLLSKGLAGAQMDGYNN